VRHDPANERGYEKFFRFDKPPFSLAPDARFWFGSASHAAALKEVTYALERREPVVVVTGEIGTGKTQLCRTVIERLGRKTFLSVVNDPMLERDDLLKHMLQDFGVISKDRTLSTPTSRHDLMHALQEFLGSLKQLHAHAAVIIDEAQHVHPDVLEQIRLVSNIQDERGTMLQIILLGQTDLEQLLARPELSQLRQRVSRRVRLDPLTATEVAQYIDHRLGVARVRQHVQSNFPGADDLERELAEWEESNSTVTFTLEALALVAQLSQGIPRVVNLLCDRALEAAYAQQSRTIDASMINTAAEALGLGSAAEAPATPEAAAAPAAASAPPTMWPRLEPTEVPAPDEEPPATNASRATQYAIVAASIVLSAATLWFASRVLIQRGESNSAPPAAAPIQPANRPQAAPSNAAPSRAAPPTAPPTSVQPSNAIPPREAPAQPVPPAAAPTADAAESAGQAFQIVVASFRTAARANDVAAQVAAAGQPVRQRMAGEWHQVLAGPYATSAQAQEAQQRLARAGFTGTQVVPTGR
jgi:general secretion pathway protein A